MKLTAAIVILLLHITFDKSHSTHLVSSYDDSEVLLSKTIESLKSALNFFNREYQNVNLDAIIGTRMVSGKYSDFLP